MKKIILLLLAIVMTVSVASCSASYSNDKSTAEIANETIAKLNDGNTYLVADGVYLDDYIQIPSYVVESEIRFCSQGHNLNEFGFFKVTDGKAVEMASLLKEYLKKSLEKNESWYNSYIPEETPKLRDAQVKTFGNYVVYAIANKEDRNAIFAAAESFLKVD